MSWILIFVGGLLLSVGALLTWLLTHRNAATYVRITLPRKLPSLLRQTAMLPYAHQEIVALADAALPLMEHIHNLRTTLRNMPSLPEDSDGEPRLMDLARDTADAGQFTLVALISALQDWPHTATTAEIQAFPVCIGAVQCQRLRLLLRTMQTDAKIRRQAEKLARRLHRSKQPYGLLDKAGLNSVGLAALAKTLRDHGQPESLVLLDRWLDVHELTTEDLAQQDTLRQVQLAEEIRQTLNCLATLERLPWVKHCEDVDALHPLLMQDPSGIYAAMTAESQLQLRLQAEMFSRRVHVEAAEIIRHALLLCADAEPRAMEQYVGYWLQDAEGIRQLHRTLPTRNGRLYAHFALRRGLLRYLLRLVLGGLLGFGFLHSGEPVFMLPCFLLVIGEAIRQVARKLPDPLLPQMDLTQCDHPLKTLVVLPAMLHDPHEAIRMVRLLKTVSHTCPQEGVEYLLLGDFAPNITAVSSGDGPIMQAAATAVSALQAELPIHYMQRCRTWDGDQHTYCARGGRLSAITELCRLIVQGECMDALAFATFEPALLERKYDFIFVLADQRPVFTGTMQALLQRMIHPMCSRYPTEHGWRGISVLSPWPEQTFHGAGLIRPGTFLEAIDGILPATPCADILSGELSGFAASAIQSPLPSPSTTAWDAQYTAAQCAWALLPWQLPWVTTTSGIISNPLPRTSKLRLRSLLWEALLPLGQLAIVLWAVLTQNWLLLLLALVLPETFRFSFTLRDFLQGLARLSLLPMRALVSVLPLWFLLPWNRHKSAQWPSLELWVQGISATVFASLGLAIPTFAAPALLLAAMFACFPLAHQIVNGPDHKEDGLTPDHFALLEDTATSTWQYFLTHVDASTAYLPPCAVQYEPPYPIEPVTSPEAIGAYLLACVCAKDLGFLSTADTAERIQQVVTTLRDLPMPAGLPYQRYSLPALAVVDARVSAASVGFFAAALMTVAQALRTWLPEMPLTYASLSSKVSDILDAMDFSAMYNKDANLFYAALDADKQPEGFIDRTADTGILLLIAAIARKQVSADCLHALRHTCVKCGRYHVPLSTHGTASDHLLAALFLPFPEEDAKAFIHAMASRGIDGLFGQDLCCTHQFDHHLRYQQAIHGVPHAAAAPVSEASVFAPFAAALALPILPRMAADALNHFSALGAKGPTGFCDAIDCTTTPALVGLQDSFHQGLLLCAVAHLLADAPLQRYFCALPEVEALLPQLQNRQPALTLRALPRRPQQALDATPTAAPIDPMQHPVPVHLLGTADFHLLADAHGMTRIDDHTLPLNHALHFYLADEGRVYHLGDPQLPGDVHFHTGTLHIEQVCGSLRSEMVVCADTLRQRALHIITVTNLSTRDRTIELADLLLPDLAAPSSTMEVSRPETEHLVLHVRGKGLRLHHMVAASVPILRTTVCTDRHAFTGRSGSLLHPALLDDPAENVLHQSDAPCLAFRTRVALGGRGQVTIWFSTSLQEHTAPLLTDLPGLRNLCALQHAAIESAAPLTDEQKHIAGLLLPFLQPDAQGVSLIAESADATPVRDLLAIWGRLHLHGLRIQLCIHCPAHLQEDFADLLPGKLAEDQVLFVALEAPPQWLCLTTSAPLDEQLAAMYTRLNLPVNECKSPLPAQLPRQELLLPGEYGGFDPSTLDYVLQLEPDQMPPLPWRNRHISRYYQEETDETGFHAPAQEQVWIQMPDGTLLSPWSPELPRAVHYRPGETDWECWSAQLDLRLRATCLPGHRCSLRALHIHNASEAALTLQVTVLVPMSAPLVCVSGLVMTDTPDKRLQTFLAGNQWQTRRVCAEPVAAVTDMPCINFPDDPLGDTALLTCSVSLSAGRSSKVWWLSGFARHGEDAVRAMAAAQSGTISDLLRQSHLPWAQRLGTITIATPERSLDVLMNRILPCQAFNAAGFTGVPTLKHLAPAEARRALLQQARKAMSRDDWAHFILIAADYIHVTQDAALLDVYLSLHSDTLLNACRSAVLSLPLDHHHLPLGDDQARRSFLFALAAQSLDKLRPDPEALAFSHTLLNAADTYLWQDSHYGTQLRLDVQTRACAAYGANPRTRQAIMSCWTTLYDQRHGLIRQQEATDIPALPGLPENGGMITLEAVRFVKALLKTDRRDDAFELLRALNPLHHTDTPERQAVFHAAPFRLHGGMCASPMQAGRAMPGGDEAAALLYAIVLEDILGFRREGSMLRLAPCVPADLDDFTITLQEGTSTWHISAERHVKAIILDGKAFTGNEIILIDDGKIHHVHFPLA